jgi:hypothetical protein
VIRFLSLNGMDCATRPIMSGPAVR